MLKSNSRMNIHVISSQFKKQNVVSTLAAITGALMSSLPHQPSHQCSDV